MILSDAALDRLIEQLQANPLNKGEMRRIE
jgi:hypothetical protein